MFLPQTTLKGFRAFKSSKLLIKKSDNVQEKETNKFCFICLKKDEKLPSTLPPVGFNVLMLMMEGEPTCRESSGLLMKDETFSVLIK